MDTSDSDALAALLQQSTPAPIISDLLKTLAEQRVRRKLCLTCGKEHMFATEMDAAEIRRLQDAHPACAQFPADFKPSEVRQRVAEHCQTLVPLSVRHKC